MVQAAGNDVILVFVRQFAEIAAPTPYVYDQVLMLLGMGLGIHQSLHVQAVELQLLAAELDENAHQHGHFADRFGVSEEHRGR